MFLKNKNIIFKIRRSKVTDYAALSNNRPLNLLFWSSFEWLLKTGLTVYDIFILLGCTVFLACGCHSPCT